jgi:hypothetical protein
MKRFSVDNLFSALNGTYLTALFSECLTESAEHWDVVGCLPGL